jgi:hypothetical protein
MANVDNIMVEYFMTNGSNWNDILQLGSIDLIFFYNFFEDFMVEERHEELFYKLFSRLIDISNYNELLYYIWILPEFLLPNNSNYRSLYMNFMIILEHKKPEIFFDSLYLNKISSFNQNLADDILNDMELNNDIFQTEDEYFHNPLYRRLRYMPLNLDIDFH